METSNINQLQDKVGKKWKILENTIAQSNNCIAKLSKLFNDNTPKILSEDCSFVVFGSLARKEYSSQSDLDWTLLVDGQTNLQHQSSVIDIQKLLKENGFVEPGKTGTFGGIIFGHDLIHYIGGADDSNENMTRRLLMLLESTPVIIKGNSTRAYDSVIRNIIKRYLNLNFSSSIKFPRFLLNDLVRYWRTMCVDFAAKEWVQGDNKWVMRNIKLRFSRKLLFVSGMIMCLDLFTEQPINEISSIQKLLNVVKKTPLEILAEFLNSNDLSEIGDGLFSSYSKFLEVLHNETKRKHLEKLEFNQINTDDIFQELRKESHIFNKLLLRLFFDENTKLKEFTREFGVF